MKKFQRADGHEFVSEGYKFSGEVLLGATKASSKYKANQLPARVDLRKDMPPVESQGKLSSCTANAVAGAYEYLAEQHLGEPYDVSRMFIYYNARYIKNPNNIKDAGSYISAAIESLKEYGACSEETYPYNPKLVDEEPDAEAYEEAERFKVESGENVPIDLNTWKGILAEGYPIIFGLTLFDTFDKHRQPGLVPDPTEKEISRKNHSAHAMLCVGYSDKDEVFIVRNSWGVQWGDKGYCYISYRYLMDKKYNLGDAWIIRQLDNFDTDSEDYWYEDDESILPDLDSEIADMSDEQWEDMLDAMGDYPLELRVAALIAFAASTDGEFSDDEWEQAVAYLDVVLETLGSDNLDSEKLLARGQKLCKQKQLMEESVSLISEHLSKGTLARMLTEFENILGVDDLSEEEERFLNMLIQHWQISDEYDQVAQEYEEDEEEEDEEDEEEEWDEDEEDDDDEEDEEDDEDWDEEEDEEDDEDWDEEEDEEDDDEDWDEDDEEEEED